MSKLNPETFERLRKALEARQRAHSGKEGTNYYEPDPAYAPLLALVQKRCWHTGSIHTFTGAELHCNSCGVVWYPKETTFPPTPVISRYDYWEAAPDGAWEGAVRKALISLYGSTMSWAFRSAFFGLEEQIATMLDAEEDTRREAVEAILAWLAKGGKK